MADETNGWPEWKNVVTIGLADGKKVDAEQQKLIQALQIEIAVIKVKSTLWGGIAGLVPSLATLIYFIIKNAK